MGRLNAAALVAAALALAGLAPSALAQDAQPSEPPPETGGAAPPGPPTGAQAPVEGMPAVPYANEIAVAADRNRIDRLLLVALVRAESNFNPEVTSRAGARGLTQLMPATARLLGLRVRKGVDERVDPVRALDARRALPARPARPLPRQDKALPRRLQRRPARGRSATVASRRTARRATTCARSSSTAPSTARSWPRRASSTARRAATSVRVRVNLRMRRTGWLEEQRAGGRESDGGLA